MIKLENSKTDVLPDDGQEVAILVEGVFYVAIFDSGKQIFRVEGELRETFFKVQEHLIYWMRVDEHR